MVDEFHVGRVSRISPEAPVPILKFDHEERRIGGAANVAHSVAALGGIVSLIGVVGRDPGGTFLAAATKAAGIDSHLVEDSSRRTTTKVRLVTERNQQVARIDYEVDDEIASDIEAALIGHARTAIAQADAIVVSDYLKGAITRRVMAELVAAAAPHLTPLLVDPKIPHIDYYAGATLVTPNHQEAEAATHVRAQTHEGAREAARLFRARARCRGVLMTRGDQGMWLLDESDDGYLPATAREVADVTGAGDTVIATCALALAAGARMSEAARLANEAAGIVVGKFGPATATPSELLRALAGAPT
jgi:D-beta-D-heptose 7-phosphate kinase/D-beta-D-heptose 1-phosphate adenosyltransferase